MIDAHLRKLRARFTIGNDEEEAIRSCISETRGHGRRETVIRAGQHLSESLLLTRGWLARVKDLSSGQRQVSELHVAGDFPDLHAYTLKRLDHDVVTLTACQLVVFPHDRLRELFARHPRLQHIYWFSTNMDAAIHREWALSLGRRSAISRLAHLFCELEIRLLIAGLADDQGYDFPLTQEDLAECLGLTSVHINRSLQELRNRGLIRVERKRVVILEREELKKVAEFDPTYLYLDGPDQTKA